MNAFIRIPGRYFSFINVKPVSAFKGIFEVFSQFFYCFFFGKLSNNRKSTAIVISSVNKDGIYIILS